MVAQRLNGEGAKGRGYHSDDTGVAHRRQRGNGSKNKQFLYCKEQYDRAHVQTNVQNGELRAGGQTFAARQDRREQEAIKENTVSELETGRYL